MGALDFLATVEVGDGAGNLDDAAIGTGEEGEAIHRHPKEFRDVRNIENPRNYFKFDLQKYRTISNFPNYETSNNILLILGLMNTTTQTSRDCDIVSSISCVSYCI